jgi:hypothetical protein
MFARSHVRLSPDGIDGGAPPLDHARDSYVALVRVLHDPPSSAPLKVAIAICASNFRNNVVPALYRGLLTPDVALRYMALKSPHTDVNVFLETGHLSFLVEHVAEVVRERIERGAAISDYALASLRGYVASPHEIGREASVAAFKAFMIGLTRCYTVTAPGQICDPVALDPCAAVSALGAELRWAAPRHPAEIADVVASLADIRVEPLLSPALEGVLLQLSVDDGRIPLIVREAARQGLSRRRQ